MIAQIYGKVTKFSGNSLFIDISGICYEILIPTSIIQRVEKESVKDGMVRLVTYHYHSLEPSKSVPVLIGFLNEVEKDFFQQFITVSGIGPKAAIRALSKPISSIARAIDEADLNFLKSLPGIGQQRAKEIVAKLQGKVGKFGLIQDEEFQEKAESDIETEAVEVLLQLQYKKQEAKEMVRLAKERLPGISTTEGLLNEVYKHRLKK